MSLENDVDQLTGHMSGLQCDDKNRMILLTKLSSK